MQSADNPTNCRQSDRVFRLNAFADDLRRAAGALEQDIKSEQSATNRSDPKAFDYPMTARSMRSRLNKIRVSLQTVEIELATDAQRAGRQSA